MAPDPMLAAEVTFPWGPLGVGKESTAQNFLLAVKCQAWSSAHLVCKQKRRGGALAPRVRDRDYIVRGIALYAPVVAMGLGVMDITRSIYSIGQWCQT